jgi:hypothetical protein
MIQERNELFQTSYVTQWKTEDNHISKYISDEENNLICIVFMHKINEYNNIDYIYTFKKYRRMGYALKLLQQLKDEEWVATCNCVESEKLFKKAGWIRTNTTIKSFVTHQNYINKYTLEINRIHEYISKCIFDRVCEI